MSSYSTPPEPALNIQMLLSITRTVKPNKNWGEHYIVIGWIWSKNKYNEKPIPNRPYHVVLARVATLEPFALEFIPLPDQTAKYRDWSHKKDILTWDMMMDATSPLKPKIAAPFNIFKQLHRLESWFKAWVVSGKAEPPRVRFFSNAKVPTPEKLMATRFKFEDEESDTEKQPQTHGKHAINAGQGSANKRRKVVHDTETTHLEAPDGNNTLTQMFLLQAEATDDTGSDINEQIANDNVIDTYEDVMSDL